MSTASLDDIEEHSAVRKVLVGLCAVVVSLGTLTGVSAQADPSWDPDVAPYMIGVPGSLLAAIGTANGSGADAAAFGAVAANTVLAPPIPGPVAPPTFAPPVTPPMVPTALGIVLIGGIVFEIGTATAKAAGVDYESLCGGDVPGFDQTLASLTLTDCSGWQATDDLKNNLNIDQALEPNGSAMGMVSCDPAGKCAKVVALTPATTQNQQDAGYCLQSVGNTAFGNEVPVVYGVAGGAEPAGKGDPDHCHSQRARVDSPRPINSPGSARYPTTT